jgi:dsDNA-binding SOS-regulon protein
MKQCIYHSTFDLRLDNGKLITADAKVFTEYDDEPHRAVEHVDFESKAERDAYIKRIDSGDLEVLIAHAEVSYHGLEGNEYLSTIVVESLPDLLAVIKEHDMIGTAAEELRKNINKLLAAVS